LTIVDVPDTETLKYAFRIGSLKKSFVLCAQSPEEKFDWILDVNNAIKELQKSQQTLKLDDSNRPAADLGQAPVWVPDSDVSSCPLCKTPFTLFFRKHHCRACGIVVCGNCSTHSLILPLDTLKVRVCDTCYKQAVEQQKAAQSQTQPAPESE